MSTRTNKSLKALLLAGAAVVALGAYAGTYGSDGIGFAGKAFAADDGDSEGGKGKMQMGAGAGGHKGKGPGTIGGAGKGQGGPDASSEGKGPRASQPGDETRGGRPVWAQEGIPEVELGRLNVARAPAHVVERALEEVLLNWTDEKTAIYSLTFDEFVAALATLEEGTRVDSPLENLALYKDLMIDGVSSTPVQPTSTQDIISLAAIYFGGASDKTVTITEDTVKAINIILGLDVNEGTTKAIADQAEIVRQAILDAHG